MENSHIKLRVNHNVNFNLEDTQIKNLLIIGNTINFFGFFNNGRINMMSMNKNDRYHYMWLLKRCKEKTNIYIIGESEECEYYTNIFNYFGSLGIRVNWKFMETKKPKDYLEKLSLLKNMKFDYIVGNPPFGSAGGDTLHLKCTDIVYDKFNKKMIIIMPFGFINKDTRSFKKYQKKFVPKLQYVKEIAGSNFEGTSMFSAAIYEFTNKETNTTIIENIAGNKIEKSDLTNVSQFTTYENEIVKFLESTGKQLLSWGGGHSHCTKQSLSRKGIVDEITVNKLIEENVVENCSEIPLNSIYLTCNCFNGAMNGKYFSSKNGDIFVSLDKLINMFKERKISNGYNVLVFNSINATENCKIALQNPLLRFTCFKSQKDQSMGNKVYKYVPAINWEDKRCLTDEGLLEMCGCPKDKAKEYAEYVKNYVEERDKEFESRKRESNHGK